MRYAKLTCAGTEPSCPSSPCAFKHMLLLAKKGNGLIMIPPGIIFLIAPSFLLSYETCLLESHRKQQSTIGGRKPWHRICSK